MDSYVGNLQCRLYSEEPEIAQHMLWSCRTLNFERMDIIWKIEAGPRELFNNAKMHKPNEAAVDSTGTCRYEHKLLEKEINSNTVLKHILNMLN